MKSLILMNLWVFAQEISYGNNCHEISKQILLNRFQVNIIYKILILRKGFKRATPTVILICSVQILTTADILKLKNYITKKIIFMIKSILVTLKHFPRQI